MRWFVLLLLSVFFTYILVQFFAIRRLKSKKGKLIDNVDGELGKIISGNKKLMLYFWTESCGVCKQLTPFINELREEFKNVFLVNLSNDHTLARKLDIMAVPTIMFIENSKIIDILIGAQRKESIKHKLIKFYSD